MMRHGSWWPGKAFAALSAVLVAAIVPVAGDVREAAAQAAKVEVRTLVLRVDPPPNRPISRLDAAPEDIAFAGAERGTADNATTGRFLGHDYQTTTVATDAEGAMGAFEAALAEGVRLFVVLADGETLTALADRAAGTAPEALILNAGARDDALRTETCRANVFHVAPSRAMLADALAQYLMWKRWDEWLVVTGEYPGDRAMAAAIERAARKFGAEIVETKVFEDLGGARADSGHVLVQRRIPVFMQDADDHDVVLVADENELFGGYIPYRTWEPRPVAGDAGLEAVTWNDAYEGWGATQLQRRFERDQERGMREADYETWLAVRVIGEAVTRTNGADPAALRDYL
ncbi:MAG: ABC transporter substrate-binding protein, partial [Pseudomonadota bacterium]